MLKRTNIILEVIAMKFKLIPNYNYPKTYNLVAYVDEFPEVTMQPIHEENGNTFWYGENADGFAQFGIAFDTDALGYEAGHVFPAYRAAFNGKFPSQCFCKDIIIAIDDDYHYGFSLKVNTLFKMLSSDYELGIYRNADGEVHIMICDVGECPKWIGMNGELVDSIICGEV